MFKTTLSKFKSIIGAVIALVVLTTVSSAQAQDTESALQVQSWCKEFVNSKYDANHHILIQPTEYTGFCWGAFASIQEVARFANDDTRVFGTRLLGICTPPTSTRSQMVKVFSKYVDDHPESADEHFTDVVIRSLQKAFPCSYGAAR